MVERCVSAEAASQGPKQDIYLFAV